MHPVRASRTSFDGGAALTDGAMLPRQRRYRRPIPWVPVRALVVTS
jgi:hypothetical protein